MVMKMVDWARKKERLGSGAYFCVQYCGEHVALFNQEESTYLQAQYPDDIGNIGNGDSPPSPSIPLNVIL